MLWYSPACTHPSPRRVSNGFSGGGSPRWRAKGQNPQGIPNQDEASIDPRPPRAKSKQYTCSLYSRAKTTEVPVSPGKSTKTIFLPCRVPSQSQTPRAPSICREQALLQLWLPLLALRFLQRSARPTRVAWEQSFRPREHGTPVHACVWLYDVFKQEEKDLWRKWVRIRWPERCGLRGVHLDTLWNGSGQAWTIEPDAHHHIRHSVSGPALSSIHSQNTRRITGYHRGF